MPPPGWDKNLPYSHPTCTGVRDQCYHYAGYGSSSDYPDGLHDAPMPHVKFSAVAGPSSTLLLLEGEAYGGVNNPYPYNNPECSAPGVRMSS